MRIAFLVTIFVISLYFLFAQVTNADVVCQPIYGGGFSCPQAPNIGINKRVINPNTGIFVDNLGVNDDKFAPDQTVVFELTITNTGNTTLSRVIVKDIFPQFVNFVSGTGTFDTNNKILSFEMNNLKSNESRTEKITGKIVSVNDLPQNQGVTCVINQATAAVDNQVSQDNAQFCIQKQVAAGQVTESSGSSGVTKGGQKIFAPPQAKTTPSTGPEAIPLLALIPTGLIGHFLRKKSKQI